MISQKDFAAVHSISQMTVQQVATAIQLATQS
jgi:hypothetical protein